MNEQTKNELKARLEEIKTQSDEAWKVYQQCEKSFNELAATSPLTAAEKKRDEAKTNWHKLYTACDGIRAILALEAE